MFSSIFRLEGPSRTAPPSGSAILTKETTENSGVIVLITLDNFKCQGLIYVNLHVGQPKSSSDYSHTDANSIQKDNHQLNSKRQKGAPLSAPYSAYTKVGTFLLHKLVQRITPVHSCTPSVEPNKPQASVSFSFSSDF